jgi:predicted AAA+ superfamily ATPase
MIKREIIPSILHWIGKEKILILKGARQVGKTTILKQIIANIQDNDKNAEIVYLQADDKKNSQIFSSTATLEEYLKRNHGFPAKFVYLFIDEFQTIENAGLFLKNIFDTHREKLQIIVSGSSSLEITKNTEFLTGRSIDFNINRISFREYFNYENKSEISPIPLSNFDDIKIFHQTFSEKINLYFKEYLAFGGYPEVITTLEHKDKKIILESIVKTYIEKDIAGFLKIENIVGFNTLIQILSSQIGNLINLSEISNTANLARNTTEKYLSMLIGTYVFDVVTPYYKNVRSELSKMPKVYALDIGIRNYFNRTLDSDNQLNGSVVENFVYLHLLEQYKKNYIHFYRTIGGGEIDFILEGAENKLTVAEVKYRSKTNIPVAIKNFSERYPESVSQKIIFTKDVLEKKPDGTIFLPVNLLPFVEL